eukprot:gene11070-biopygen3101
MGVYKCSWAYLHVGMCKCTWACKNVHGHLQVSERDPTVCQVLASVFQAKELKKEDPVPSRIYSGYVMNISRTYPGYVRTYPGYVMNISWISYEHIQDMLPTYPPLDMYTYPNWICSWICYISMDMYKGTTVYATSLDRTADPI